MATSFFPQTICLPKVSCGGWSRLVEGREITKSPKSKVVGAGNGDRTRDFHLGKVALYR
jgi:hypothetical protein